VPNRIYGVPLQRDLELVRKLLLHFEAKQDDTPKECPPIEGYVNLQIKYHLLLMDEASLIRCERQISKSTPTRVISVLAFSLTWQGHEFLDASRNENIWNKALTLTRGRLTSIPFSVLESLLIYLSKDALGLGDK
jgi:hypothetical protein